MAKGHSCEHDECWVVHEFASCPLCVANNENADMETKIEELEKDLDEAQDRIIELESQLQETDA